MLMVNGVGMRLTLKPCFMDMCPAARFMRSLGTKRGETFLGPCRILADVRMLTERGDSHLCRVRERYRIVLRDCRYLSLDIFPVGNVSYVA